jgi:hypothetical protein
MFCHTEKRKTRGKGSGVKQILKKRRLLYYSFSTPILTFSLPAEPRLQLCRRGICHTTNLAIWDLRKLGKSYFAREKNCP